MSDRAAPQQSGSIQAVATPRLGDVGLFAAFTTIVLWSGNTIVTKAAASAIEPSSIAFYRWGMAFVVLTPFMGRAVWNKRAIVSAHLWQLAVLGMLGMAFFQGLSYEAAKTTTAVKMGVVVATMPLMTALMASVLSGEALTWRRIAGTLVSFTGLIVMITAGNPLKVLGDGVAVGDVMMVVAVAANALYGVLLKRWAIPLPGWQQLYVQIIFGTLVILPFWLMLPKSPVTATNLPLILYAGVAASLLAPFCWITGVRRIGAARASLFLNLLPVIVAVLAYFVLGEHLQVYHVVGGAVALIGVAIAL